MERLNSVCLLVRMTTPSEFVTVDLEKAWRTLLSYNSFTPYFYCNCNVLLSELTATRRHQKEKAMKRNGLLYIVLNEKHIFTSLAISSSILGTKL